MHQLVFSYVILAFIYYISKLICASLRYLLQLRDNEQLSRLVTEQEARLGEFERQVESQTQEAEDRRRMLEDVQSDKATISRALTQNRTLKDQLAELQNGFVKLVRIKTCPVLFCLYLLYICVYGMHTFVSMYIFI